MVLHIRAAHLPENVQESYNSKEQNCNRVGRMALSPPKEALSRMSCVDVATPVGGGLKDEDGPAQQNTEDFQEEEEAQTCFC